MKDTDFQTIHDLGIHSLVDKLKRYGGYERKEMIPAVSKNAVVRTFESGEDNYSTSGSGIYLEGVHFDLVYTPLKHLGYKLLTAAGSHLYAMNAQPISAQIDIAVPNKISVSMLEQLFQGFDKAGKIYHCSVLPGDITASHQMLVISVHVEGITRKDELITLEGARSGEQFCVTGDLGGAVAGLHVLLREKNEWKESGKDYFKPDLQEYEYVVQRQLMPTARYDLINAFRQTGVKPTSMIDVSQGLVNEIQRITEANHIGCEIFTPAVPISLDTRKVADEMQEDVDRYAFYGGEDYEILFTLKDEDVEKLKVEFEDFSVIGEVKSADQGIVINTGEGQSINLSETQKG
jgi:thiamine-monophosphate kinase